MAKMKRKLLSSEATKGNQEITKFFKGLMSQGSKQGTSGMDNCSMKINGKSAHGFRVPILEKFKAMKKEASPFQNNNQASSTSDKGVEQCASMVDVEHDTKYHFGSSTPADQCDMTNSRGQNVKILEKSLNGSLTFENGMIHGVGSFASCSMEASDPECNESFVSACEELDSTANAESFKDAVDSSPCNCNTTRKIASVERSCGMKCPSPNIKYLSSGYSVSEVNCKPKVHENLHLSSLNIESNSFDDHSSDNYNSSDEELLMPPRFLSFNKLKPDVKTPEKETGPEHSSPITSLTTRETKEEAIKFKYKLSFNKLIAVNIKQKEEDAEVAKMEAALKCSVQTKGVAQFEPGGLNDLESEEELTDDGRDLKDCTLPQDIKKFLIEVHDFSDEVPGEDIFPLFVPVVFSQDVPCLTKFLPPAAGTFEDKLFSASALDLQELLCGGWILQHYLGNPCSVQVSEWLFEIMCRSQDQHMVSSSFQVLWVMLDAATEKRDDLPHVPRGSSWLPSLRNIIAQLLSFGATLPRLYPGGLANDLNVHELVSNGCPQVNNTEEVTLLNSGIKTENFPVVNIMHLVQFATYGLQKCPLSYTVQNLRQLVVLLCRLALDVRLQSVVFDIEMCIAAVLNCFGDAQWPDEVKELCRIMAKVTTNHQNLLHVVQLQPASSRGIYLQRLLSLTLLHWLVPRFASQESYQNRGVKSHARCDVDVPDSVEVSSLLKLVEKIKPGKSSDYFLLHSVITLVNLTVGSEDVAPKERAALERLTNRLRSLNGDIKDPRAAFMDRTKVKDLLVRTIHRLAYMTQCIKPVREITNYFECSSSDYQIELLKETVGQDDIDANEKDEHGDEKMMY